MLLQIPGGLGAPELLVILLMVAVFAVPLVVFVVVFVILYRMFTDDESE